MATTHGKWHGELGLASRHCAECIAVQQRMPKIRKIETPVPVTSGSR